MNTLSAFYTRGMSLLAAAPAAPAKDDGGGFTIFGSDGIIGWPQGLLIILMLGLIAFWLYYRKKQRDEG